MTLVAGIVVGTLVGWPIFAAGGKGVPQGDANIAAYDVEVLCGYSAAGAQISGTEDFDIQEAPIWRLHAVGGLALAVARAEPAEPALEEAGEGLISAASRLALHEIDEHVQAIQTFCDARSDR